MGYRSDVVIALNKEVYAQHLLLLGEFPTLLRDNSPVITETAAYWRLSEIKWYTDYPYIRDVMRLLGSLDTEQYAFMRIGEDDQDIEHQGEPGDFNIYLSQSIDAPV
jgi:hypothetical protein